MAEGVAAFCHGREKFSSGPTASSTLTPRLVELTMPQTPRFMSRVRSWNGTPTSPPAPDSAPCCNISGMPEQLPWASPQACQNHSRASQPEPQPRAEKPIPTSTAKEGRCSTQKDQLRPPAVDGAGMSAATPRRSRSKEGSSAPCGTPVASPRKAMALASPPTVTRGHPWKHDCGHVLRESPSSKKIPVQQRNDELDTQELSWWRPPKPFPIGLESCENEPPVVVCTTCIPEGVVTAPTKGALASVPPPLLVLPAEGRAELARQQAIAKLPPQPPLGTRLAPGLTPQDMSDAGSLEALCSDAPSQTVANDMQSLGEPPTALPIPFKDECLSPPRKAEWPAEMARHRALHALTQAQATERERLCVFRAPSPLMPIRLQQHSNN